MSGRLLSARESYATSNSSSVMDPALESKMKTTTSVLSLMNLL